jgi:hypothetical protein
MEKDYGFFYKMYEECHQCISHRHCPEKMAQQYVLSKGRPQQMMNTGHVTHDVFASNHE